MRFEKVGLKDTDVVICAKRSDNQTFEYETANWRVQSLKGLDTPPLELFTEKKGVGDGSYLTGMRYDARDIDITARSQLKGTIVADRDAAVSFHDASKTYTLTIFYMGRFAVISNCVLQGFKCVNSKTSRQCEIEVSYLSLDALIDSTGEYSTETVSANGTASGTFYYYPLTNVLSLKAEIRRIEFTAANDISYLKIGPNKSQLYFGTTTNAKIRSGQHVVIIPDAEAGKVYVYTDGVLKKMFTTSVANDLYTSSSREQFMLIVYDLSSNTTQPDIDITYAHSKGTNVRGI